MKKSPTPSVGISSILMIFMVLCLTTFGILSFSSARADLNLMKKNASAVKTYYEADAASEELLVRADALFAASSESVSYYLSHGTAEGMPNRNLYPFEPDLAAVAASAQAEILEDELFVAFLSALVAGDPDFSLSGTTQEGLVLSWAVPVGDSQQIEVSDLPSFNAPKRYQVLSHKLATTAQWEGDEQQLDVWQG